MPHTLQIRLFGDFQILYQGQTVTALHQERPRSLLAYLLLHASTPQSRRHLAFRLWPDSTEAQALTNLRRELHSLRKILPEAEHFLDIGTQTVQWRANGACGLDVADFVHELVQAEAAEKAGDPIKLCAALGQAVEIYTGDLLPSCYDEWILQEREELRQQGTGAMERLAQLQEEQLNYGAAIQVAERLLRHDPIHEATYRRLIRLYVLNGDRAHALRVYHTCVAALQRELDVEPSAETQALYQSLLDGGAGTQLSTQSPPAATIGNVPLVAREAEWQQLQQAWQLAGRNRIHFVLISGEAGIGKTRLAEELLTWANQHTIATARSRSYAAEGQLAYAPVVEWLRADAFQATRRQLGEVWLSEVARLLPEVIEERPELPRLGPLTDNSQRLRFFEGLARALLLGSQPLILLIDDLQWCDQDSLEWLRYLMHFAQGTAAQRLGRPQLLILGTARAEEIGSDHPLRTLRLALYTSEQLTELELATLSEAETTGLAQRVAGQPLDPAQVAQLYRDTEGNPLFIAETLRNNSALNSLKRNRISLMDDHPTTRTSTPHDLQLPPKIYAVIHSRLSQLSAPARELASLAATIGRAFTFDLVAKASDAGEDTLVRALDELWQRRIVREQSVGGYDFSHDRLRDVAYAEITPARRRLLHRRVAQALEQVNAGNLDTASAQIASHYAQAGLPQLALDYYKRAAAAAIQVYAHADAVNHLTTAISLLAQLPPAPERPAQELRLLLDLGRSLGTLKGFSDPGIRAVYTRAHELAEQVGNDEERLMALGGLFSYHLWRAEVRAAHALAEQEVAIAEKMNDSTWFAQACGALGVAQFNQGQWQASRKSLEQSLAILERQHSHSRPESAGQHSVVLLRRFLANVLWFLGYPDQALAHMQAALAQARQLAHPLTLASALSGLASFHRMRREIEETRVQSEAAMNFAQQQGISRMVADRRFDAGWVLVQQGEVEAGIAQMQEHLAYNTHSAHRINQSGDLAALAEANGVAGRPERGIYLLDQALQQIEESGDHRTEVEVRRLKGELLLISGAEEVEVEAHLLYALRVARQQEARLLELRVAISLSRLCQHQGRLQEAHTLLSAIYNWFTEGFDTPDLRDARSLLAELSQS